MVAVFVHVLSKKERTNTDPNPALTGANTHLTITLRISPFN